MADVDFEINFESFQQGFSPSAHLDPTTFEGNRGNATEMQANILSLPGYIKQSPKLVNLTNGSQAGAVDQLIRFILDKPVSESVTYAVGTSKLFKLTPTTVVNNGTPTWPQAVPNMTEGESIIQLGTDILVFYNKASGGDIAKMDLATETIDDNWGSGADEALIKAPHPVAIKEDIVVFGNGQYLGVIRALDNFIDTKKLDFGAGAEVVDVAFYANMWYVSVNFGEGRRSKIVLYEASAISNQLADEVAVGNQEIGFTFVNNGILYVAYQDKTSGYFAIAWLSGRQLKPLKYFTGTLPNHRQKTLYMNTLLFVSGDDVLSFGSVVDQLPIQISVLSDGGFSTVGGLAAPFGTPLIASTEVIETVPNYKIAKYSGYSKEGFLKTICIDTSKGRDLGKIGTVIVMTKALEAGARADLTIEGNQGSEISNVLQVTGTGKRCHVFTSVILGPVEDIRCAISHANSSETVDCPIRKITVLGNFTSQ